MRRPRAAKAGRRRKTKDKTRRKTKGGPKVLCQLMSAQAGHHRLMGVVTATDGEALEDYEDLVQQDAEMQPD